MIKESGCKQIFSSLFLLFLTAISSMKYWMRVHFIFTIFCYSQRRQNLPIFNGCSVEHFQEENVLTLIIFWRGGGKLIHITKTLVKGACVLIIKTLSLFDTALIMTNTSRFNTGLIITVKNTCFTAILNSHYNIIYF